MSRFIQSLESRKLLSATLVTTSTLLADQAVLVADAAAAKAELKALAAVAGADAKTIAADLKGLPKTNAPLLKTLKADEAKLLALITKDVKALLTPGIALGKRASVDGVLLIKKPSAKLQAKVAAELTALGTATAGPLAKLQADSQGGKLSADLQALVAANPSNAGLAAHTAKFLTDVSAQGNTVNDTAVKFQTDIAGVATDLGSAASSSSTIPTVTGTYSGTAKETAGKHVGRVAALTVDITGESAAGALTGTFTLTEPGQTPVTLSLSGQVTAAGAFSATLTDTSGQGNGAILSGSVVGQTISGKYQSTGGPSRGTFTVHK